MHARVHGQPGSSPGLDFQRKLSNSRTLLSPRFVRADSNTEFVSINYETGAGCRRDYI